MSESTAPQPDDSRSQGFVANPVATIVTVSDHKTGDAESWEALRRTYRHLAEQECSHEVEYMLVETEGAAHKAIPDDIEGLLPGLRIATTPGISSFDLKNAGAQAARSSFIIILDADCRPGKGWLQAVTDHHLSHPEAAVISGRTFYEGEGLLPKIFAIIDRTYVDAGKAGPTWAIPIIMAALPGTLCWRTPSRMRWVHSAQSLTLIASRQVALCCISSRTWWPIMRLPAGIWFVKSVAILASR